MERPLPLAFNTDDPAWNMALGVAAWRLFGSLEDVLCEAKGGLIWVGPEEDYGEFAEEQGLEPSYNCWEPEELYDCDLDTDAVKEVLSIVQSGDEDAKALYAKFHWGDESQVVKTVTIPGVTFDKALVQLGVADELWYTARKAGELIPFRHTFAEDSGEPVTAYCTADGRTLVIHGGNMRVEERGIID